MKITFKGELFVCGTFSFSSFRVASSFLVFAFAGDCIFCTGEFTNFDNSLLAASEAIVANKFTFFVFVLEVFLSDFPEVSFSGSFDI